MGSTVVDGKGGRPREGAPGHARKEVQDMQEKIVIDLGRLMDEIFESAEKVGRELQESFNLDKLGEKIRAKWDETTDYYPAYTYPPLNVYMRPDKTLVFEFALAGFDEKKIDLSFRGDYMIFSAQVADHMLHEPGIRFFKRRLRFKDVTDQKYFVPDDKFDRENVRAVFKNGVLKVEVPPRAESSRKGSIKIDIVREDEV